MKESKNLITQRRWIRRSVWMLAIIFVLMNLVAILHSYKLMHFTEHASERTKDPKNLTTIQKIKTLIFGVDNPRPENKSLPKGKYQTIKLKSNKETECWHIKTESPSGTVIIFHGFSGEKSSMLERADVFNELGYNTFLVDFMGSGGSEGNQTTIGYKEAEQVNTCFRYLKEQGEENIYLFGTSMGAVAIMKCINDYKINPKGIILECPFGSMYQTVCARFKLMGVPTFPMAGLLVFWGGIENGFWAFAHNPTAYANKINCPTLLLYGAKDDRVSRQQIDEIFTNLAGVKQLKIYQHAGHENYLTEYKDAWTQDVKQFMATEHGIH